MDKKDNKQFMYKKIVNLNIGEYYASKEQVLIKTILGSCVSVCLFDPVNSIGGMNHISLPGKAKALNNNIFNTKYAVNAMELLVKRIINLGGEKRNFIAKVYGGGQVFNTSSTENSIGFKNIEFINNLLKNEGIKIIHSDMGGMIVRRISFNTNNADTEIERFHYDMFEELTELD